MGEFREDMMEQLLTSFTNQSIELLGDNLAGIYLHGSAAMGCFNPAKSDVDLITVVREPVPPAVRRAYMDMVIKLHSAGPAKGIEMSVVTQDVCRPFVYPTPFILHFSAAHLEWYRNDPDGYIREMRGVDKDLAAHFTVIKKRGRCLYGAPADDVFAEVPVRDYIDSIWNDVSGAEEEIADNPMYLILNLARVLAYIRTKLVLSKKEGGEWALGSLPQAYHPLIREALAEYAGSAEITYDTAAAREYAAYMLGQISGALM